MKLFYDSETTGLPLFKEPSEDPRQPHIVQLAAHLVDPATRTIVETIDVIVKPDGWEIPEEVSAIHGITTERALDEGIPERDAVEQFLALHRRAESRIAHNEQFDQRIIRIALKRYEYGDEFADAFKACPSECTAKLSSSILNLPPTPAMVRSNRNWPKTPTLAEAYQFFTGTPLENAHSALADVNGCMTVYWAIKDREASATQSAA